MESFDPREITDDEIRAALQSHAFQQILFYQRLASGISILEENKTLVDLIVQTWTERHSEIESEDLTRELITILGNDIYAAVEPADNEIADKILTRVDVQKHTDDSPLTQDEAKAMIKENLESRLRDTDTVELRAKEIATETGLKSTHVGGILGRWRKSDDAPFDISASKDGRDSTTWVIESV